MVPYFHSEDDEKNENLVGHLLEKPWRCVALRAVDPYSRVDWNFVRGKVVIAIGELKARTHPIDKYPTVFLSVSKYEALMDRKRELDVKAVFVVRFSCGTIRWIHADEIDNTKVRIAGRPPRPGSVHDQEPIIDVPIAQMRRLKNETP